MEKTTSTSRQNQRYYRSKLNESIVFTSFLLLKCLEVEIKDRVKTCKLWASWLDWDALIDWAWWFLISWRDESRGSQTLRFMGLHTSQEFVLNERAQFVLIVHSWHVMNSVTKHHPLWQHHKKLHLSINYINFILFFILSILSIMFLFIFFFF